jgi:pimeloyl-ACP methyl ester carboxylesterase
MEVLRTPDERFTGLPDWPYEPLYVDDLPGYEGLRMHYVDVGPRDAPVTFVCLHGEPTWGYLYRRMIPVFVESGHRVIAPDLFGFGRSDKPADDGVYSFAFHRDALKRFFERCELLDACLVVQDWGGLLGLTLPMDYAERITRLLVMNTGLGTGRPVGPGFEAWRAYCAANPDLDVGALMQRATPHLSEAEAGAYSAPFPDRRYKAGVRRFPELVQTRPEMAGVETGREAAEFLAREWLGQSFMAIGMQDPVLGEPVMRALHRRIRNCPEPMLLAEAGHFVQEWGAPVARAALAHFGLEDSGA